MTSARMAAWFGGKGSWLLLAALAALSLVVRPAAGEDWPQFRGPNRNGKTSETGLLQAWPEGGPEMVWSVGGLGKGFTSASIADGMVYTTGMEGSTGYIYAYDLQGNPLWKKAYGPEWTGQYPGTRTTPTVDDGLLYVISAHGLLASFDAKTGEPVWAVDTKEKFGARRINWGLAESPLIDGPNVICTPGGPEAGMVALNKKTGETVWVCSQLGDKAGYCSPILFERGGRRIIATLMANSLAGVDADSGELLWRHERTVNYDIHATSPVYSDGRIYVTSGYGGEKGQMFEVSEDGAQLTPAWKDSELDVHHGGVVLLDGRIYGASDRNNRGKWVCMVLEDGEVLAKTDAVGKGAVIYADGRLYGYGERGGLGLVNPNPQAFELVSSAKVTLGDDMHWAHPSISNGRLYVRHGDTLMCYDISAK